MTRLLAAIWWEEAASPEACRDMRRMLTLQVCRHRLAAGFPDDEVRVAAKSGTFMNLRHEVGVVGGRQSVSSSARRSIRRASCQLPSGPPSDWRRMPTGRNPTFV